MAAAIGGKEYTGQPLVVGEVVDEMGRTATSCTTTLLCGPGRGRGRSRQRTSGGAGITQAKEGPVFDSVPGPPDAGSNGRWRESPMDDDEREEENGSGQARQRQHDARAARDLGGRADAADQQRAEHHDRWHGFSVRGGVRGSPDLTSFEHVFDSSACPLPPSELRSRGHHRRLTSWRCFLHCRAWCRGYGGGGGYREAGGGGCRFRPRPGRRRK